MYSCICVISSYNLCCEPVWSLLHAFSWHTHEDAGAFFLPNCSLLHLSKHSLSNKDGKRDRLRERNWWQSVGIVPPVYNNISLPSWPGWAFLLDVALHKLHIPCYFFSSFVFSSAAPSNRNTPMQCLSGVPSLDFSLQTALHACLGTGWHRQQPGWRAQWLIPKGSKEPWFLFGLSKWAERWGVLNFSKRIMKCASVVSLGHSALFWCDARFNDEGTLWCVLKAYISTQILWKYNHESYLWLSNMDHSVTDLFIRFP